MLEGEVHASECLCQNTDRNVQVDVLTAVCGEFYACLGVQVEPPCLNHSPPLHSRGYRVHDEHSRVQPVNPVLKQYAAARKTQVRSVVATGHDTGPPETYRDSFEGAKQTLGHDLPQRCDRSPRPTL